jgi:hypothetical protein
MLKSLPANMPFQSCPKPTKIAENIITSMKHVYDGNDDGRKFNLVNEKVSTYALKVLEVVTL